MLKRDREVPAKKDPKRFRVTKSKQEPHIKDPSFVQVTRRLYRVDVQGRRNDCEVDERIVRCGKD
jgi:hypothetical protein